MGAGKGIIDMADYMITEATGRDLIEAIDGLCEMIEGGPRQIVHVPINVIECRSTGAIRQARYRRRKKLRALLAEIAPGPRGYEC